jgi:hypothetical protein
MRTTKFKIKVAAFLTLFFLTSSVGAQNIVGLWHIKVPVSNGGYPPFEALHLFHAGGTFSEVSSLLPSLAETPAFGLWESSGSDYQLSFQLFAFDSSGAAVGRVQVRCLIQLVGMDSLEASYSVDFIDPAGVVIPDIDSGLFYGQRITLQPLTGIDNGSMPGVATNYRLHQNVPNPFNPATVIQYEVQKPAHISIHIYNTLGQLVRTLVDRQETTGVYRITWDGRNDQGERVASGVYIYQMQADEFTGSKRMVLLR